GVPLFITAGNVQYLSGNGNNNLAFQDINILAGSVGNGQTVTLNAIGTDTSKLRYVFSANFTVQAGGTLNVGGNVSVLVPNNVTMTDSGTLTFATGDKVALGVSGFGALGEILVSNAGLFTAAGTTFTQAGAGEVYFDNGSVLQANGGLTGNSFNAPLYVAAGNVQSLSGTGNNNLAFQDINILAGSVSSNQTVALNAIGTDTSKLRYVFSANFTVQAGGTLNVGAN